MSIHDFDEQMNPPDATPSPEPPKGMSEEAYKKMTEAGAKAWADVPDAAAWVRELRDGPKPTPPDALREAIVRLLLDHAAISLDVAADRILAAVEAERRELQVALDFANLSAEQRGAERDALASELAQAREEIADLKNAGGPPFIRSEAIRNLRDQVCALKSDLAASEALNGRLREALEYALSFAQDCEVAEDRSNLDGDLADAVLEQVNDDAEKTVEVIKAALAADLDHEKADHEVTRTQFADVAFELTELKDFHLAKTKMLDKTCEQLAQAQEENARLAEKVADLGRLHARHCADQEKIARLAAEVEWWKNRHDENEKLEDEVAANVQATIAALRARCAELGRDKERLDWLQAEHDAKVNTYPIMELVAKVRYVRDSHEWASLAPGSIRQAIDAARDAGKEDK